MDISKLISQAQQAKAAFAAGDSSQRNKILKLLVDGLERDREKILAANQADVKQVAGKSDDAFIDRLVLNDQRFDDMVTSVKSIMSLPDILGKIYDSTTQPSGLVIAKMRIPLGIILMIYESRPNVTIDAAALAIKTGNVIILKGGHEVQRTNKALGDVLTSSLKRAGLPAGAVTVLTSQSRLVTKELLKHDEAIDLVIPRGSRQLLEFVQANTNIPTLLHLEGNCHVYIDAAANPKMALRVALDAKTQRLGTCNTAESLLIHRDIAEAILPVLASELSNHKIEIRGDEAVCRIVKQAVPASEGDWSQEYLGPTISVKVVDSLAAATTHINKYGSGHTDSIVTDDASAAERFLRQVNSASVMHNTSTRLADGYEFGLGAEIGTSTGKLHARGPVGQAGLTTYKWIVKSRGLTKSGILGKE